MMNDGGYQLQIEGAVQGLGIRPALARLAESQGWSGRVWNTASGVTLILQSVTLTADQLLDCVRTAHPALSTAAISIFPCESGEIHGFQIDDSTSDGHVANPVPLDRAVCPDCLQEFHAAGDRRFQHGLISCTRCGPRYSIIQAMPYDRPRTTLAEFPLCQGCRADYQSPHGRRRHAQTVSCPNCGPRIWATDRHGRQLATADEACQRAAAALLAGRIVALLGIGGYQLLADATQEHAVATLRDRKQRRTKPLAVMCRSWAEAEQLGEFDHAARQLLLSPANPIVIVPRRFEFPLASGIHPCLRDIGIMLPTTAVHERLLQLVQRPLVCTSGNREGSPLVVDVSAALAELAGIADLWLHHDRPIAHPIDDSVVRSMAGRVVTLRCARGLAPLPLEIPFSSSLMATGSYQKAAIALSNGTQAALGPHVGDLDDLATRERWQKNLRDLSQLYRCESRGYVTDGHPDDIPQRLIPSDAARQNAWHHHAHIAAGMLEHSWCQESVIGIAADGQGYGPDGQLWGGEVLLANATGFQRLASLRPFALPGGEAAVLDAARVVVSLLSQLTDQPSPTLAEIAGHSIEYARRMHQVLRSRMTCWTSSLGRLFDAVAWIILGPLTPSSAGEPAAWLEAICEVSAQGAYDWSISSDTDPWQIDWRPMVRQLLNDKRAGIAPGVMAERFHRGVARWMIEVYRRCPPLPLVVGGGVFQNRRLCELLSAEWPSHGPRLGLPGSIPPNDGGLAVGQLLIASARDMLTQQKIPLRKRGQLCA